MASEIIGLLARFDKIIAGIPDNSRYRLELAQLRSQISILAEENAQLKSQLDKLQSKPEIPVEAVKILQYFFEEDGAFNVYAIAQHFNLKPNVAKYHCDLLLAKNLLTWYDKVIMNNNPPRLGISSVGRAFVMDNNLSSQ